MADGLAKHPEYYGKRMHPDMRLPGDTRKLRSIKIKEIPTWFMKRDWSPLGMMFAAKRFKYRFHSKFTIVKNPGGNMFMICAVWLGILSYAGSHKYLKHEKLRKYH